MRADSRTVFLGSRCTISEEPATLTAPPTGTTRPGCGCRPPMTRVRMSLYERDDARRGHRDKPDPATHRQLQPDQGRSPATARRAGTHRAPRSSSTSAAPTDLRKPSTLADTDSFQPRGGPAGGRAVHDRGGQSAVDRSGLRLAAGPVHRRRRDADREHRVLPRSARTQPGRSMPSTPSPAVRVSHRAESDHRGRLRASPAGSRSRSPSTAGRADLPPQLPPGATA